MKIISSLMLSIFCFGAFIVAPVPAHASASGADLKITSFVVVGGTLADLCGSMTPAPATPTFVQVTVDPNFKTEAHYNTVVGSDGKFCISVTTYAGKANLSFLK